MPEVVSTQLPPAAAQIPAVNTQLQELAALPPGPAAQSKIADILALIVTMLTNPAVAAILPIGWKMWTAAVVAVITLIGGSFATGRWSAPSAPSTEKPADKPPVTVIVNPPRPGGDVTPPIAPPSPIVPPASQNKVIVYRTPSVDPKEIAKLPAGATVDAKIYPAGSSYPWGGTSIPLPCAALVGSAGVVLDVVPFVNAAGVEKLLARTP